MVKIYFFWMGRNNIYLEQQYSLTPCFPTFPSHGSAYSRKSPLAITKIRSEIVFQYSFALQQPQAMP